MRSPHEHRNSNKRYGGSREVRSEKEVKLYRERIRSLENDLSSGAFKWILNTIDWVLENSKEENHAI